MAIIPHFKKMNKYLLLIIVLAVKQSCLTGQNFFHVDWIAYQGGYYNQTPYIVNFEADSLYIATTTKPDGEKHAYFIKNDSLIIDDNRFFADIISIDQDSLVMRLKDNFHATIFKKLDYHIIKEDTKYVNDLFYNSSWNLLIRPNLTRYDFDGKYWRNYRFRIQSDYYNDCSKDNGRYYGIWSIQPYIGNLFLNLCYSQDGDENTFRSKEVFQIMSITKDTIQLISFDGSDSELFVLNRIPEISPDSINMIQSILVSKKWNLAEYEKSIIIDSSSYYHNPDTVSYENLTCGKSVDEKYYIKNKVGLVFKPNGLFEFYVDNKLFRKSNWEISRDGKSIFIHYLGYYNIIRITDTELIINRYEEFKGRRKKVYIGYYNLEVYK